VPAGRWGVAVSGGADSVALLRLLAARADLALHVVHLDHQTRAGASATDAQFVRELAASLGLPATVALRQTIEDGLGAIAANPSARYRAARLELFRTVTARETLQGVILAHHADDQAETVLQRLIRGSAAAGLAGMSVRTSIGDLTLLRPLLCIRGSELRALLVQIGQVWREDASNESDDYLRNRLRRWLRDEPELHGALLALTDACRGLRGWSSRTAPQLGEVFEVRQLADLPHVLAGESAHQWLVARGASGEDLTEAVLDRLMGMARDAATPPRVHFPGSLLVRRRGGIVSAG
jgi:tRNA(Ile)-lysidine synthase